MDTMTSLPYPRASEDIPGAMLWTGIVLAVLAVFDLVLVFVLGIARSNKAHWFLVHSFANAFVVVLAAPDVFYTLIDPVTSLNISSCDDRLLACNDYVTCIALAVHLYHVIAYRNLTADDWFHHGLFCTTIIPMHFMFCWGVWANTLPFFISGLPGGIDYLLLALVKLHKMQSLTEKRINAFLNMWIRAPGIISVCVINYCAYQHIDHHIPAVVCFAGYALVVFNAQYYSERVIASLHVNVHKHKTAVRHVSDILSSQNLREI
eukprot:PhM_4_TR11828/c0_g1_i1/m.7951